MNMNMNMNMNIWMPWIWICCIVVDTTYSPIQEQLFYTVASANVDKLSTAIVYHWDWLMHYRVRDHHESIRISSPIVLSTAATHIRNPSIRHFRYFNSKWSLPYVCAMSTDAYVLEYSRSSTRKKYAIQILSRNVSVAASESFLRAEWETSVTQKSFHVRFKKSERVTAAFPIDNSSWKYRKFTLLDSSR